MPTRFSTTPLRFLALGIVLIAAGGIASAQTTVTAAEYRGLVATYQRAAAAPNSPFADTARRQLAAIEQVRLPDGRLILLDPATFASSTSAENAKARAEILNDLLVPPVPGPSQPDPKDAARKILADPEYESIAEKQHDDTWLENLLKQISEIIRNFLRWLRGDVRAPKGDVSGLGTFLAFLLRFVLFVAIAVAVVWGAIYLSRYISFQRFKKARGTMATGLDLDDTITDPLGKAKEMAAQGEMRQALRLAYIASLRRLAGSGLLVLQESRTNWEYQAVLRSRDMEVYTALLPATRLFDLVWYGRREATPEEFARVLAIHDALPEARVEDVTPTASGASPTPAKKGNDNAW